MLLFDNATSAHHWCCAGECDCPLGINIAGQTGWMVLAKKLIVAKIEGCTLLYEHAQVMAGTGVIQNLFGPSGLLRGMDGSFPGCSLPRVHQTFIRAQHIRHVRTVDGSVPAFSHARRAERRLEVSPVTDADWRHFA